MSVHGNSNQNKKPHHLYAIDDLEENDIFKFGISDKPIDENGYSKRMQEQVDYLNSAVGWIRFTARIILRKIFGKKKARQIENEHIDAFEKKYARRPRGNRK